MLRAAPPRSSHCPENRENHGSAFAEVDEEWSNRLHRLRRNVFGKSHAIILRIEALNRAQGRLRESISYISARLPGGADFAPADHASRWYKRAQTCAPRVAAPARRYAHIKDEIFRAAARKSCIPDARSSAKTPRASPAWPVPLDGQVRADVAVHKHDLALI